MSFCQKADCQLAGGFGTFYVCSFDGAEDGLSHGIWLMTEGCNKGLSCGSKALSSTLSIILDIVNHLESLELAAHQCC